MRYPLLVNGKRFLFQFPGKLSCLGNPDIILKFSLNEVNLDDVLLLLINKYHIKDFRIDDISIEDITKKLYEKNDKKD